MGNTIVGCINSSREVMLLIWNLLHSIGAYILKECCKIGKGAEKNHSTDSRAREKALHKGTESTICLAYQKITQR